MRRRRPGIGAELLPIALILVCLAGTLGLVVTMHRRGNVSKPLAKPVPTSPILAELPKTPKPLAPAILPPPIVAETDAEEEKPQAPAPPAVDPTQKALAALQSEAAEQERARNDADAKAAVLEVARKNAVAESSRWRRREALIKSQLSELDNKAKALEQEADALAMERDLLAAERDASKALIQKSKSAAGGYSVLPNKTANGTWQRPVIIECSNGEAILQPRGLHFGLLDMSPLLGPRGSPLIGAVAKELMKIQGSASPDGSPMTPYIYFIVRPDGVRPFYDARSRLEPLGIAFGYELVEKDWEIEYPDFDNLTAWDGTGVPFSAAKTKPTVAQNHKSPESWLSAPANRRPTGATIADEGGQAFLWPADRPSPKGTTGGNGSDNPHLWPRGGEGAETNGSGSSFLGTEEASLGMGGTNSRGIGPLASPGDPSAGGDLNDLPAPGGSGFGRPGDASQGGGSPGGAGSRLAQRNQGISPSPLVPIGPDGLPDFGKAENLVPDSRRPTGAGNLEALNPLLSENPRRPATGRVRIDPNVLSEVVAAQDEEDQWGKAPSSSGMPGSDQTNPVALPDASSDPLSPRMAGSGETNPVVLPSPSSDPLSGGRGTPRGGTNSSGLSNSSIAKTLTGTGSGSMSQLDPTGGLPPSGSASPNQADSNTAQPTTGSTSGSPSQSSQSSATPNSSNKNTAQAKSSSNGSSGQPPSMPSSGSPSSSSDSGIEVPSFGSAGSQGGESKSDGPKVEPKKLLAKNSIQIPLDLVVACGPDGLVIHPGGYRISRAALAKDGLLKKDLQTIVRNHELVDALVKPIPRLQFLVEAGGNDTYAQARRQTVLSGLSWPVTVKVSQSSAARVFPKERF